MNAGVWKNAVADAEAASAGGPRARKTEQKEARSRSVANDTSFQAAEVQPIAGTQGMMAIAPERNSHARHGVASDASAEESACQPSPADCDD